MSEQTKTPLLELRGVSKRFGSVQALYQVHKSFRVPAEENAVHEHIANHENLTGPAAANCPANLIKMSVAPDGKSYTISVPSFITTTVGSRLCTSSGLLLTSRP